MPPVMIASFLSVHLMVMLKLFGSCVPIRMFYAYILKPVKDDQCNAPGYTYTSCERVHVQLARLNHGSGHCSLSAVTNMQGSTIPTGCTGLGGNTVHCFVGKTGIPFNFTFVATWQTGPPLMLKQGKWESRSVHNFMQFYKRAHDRPPIQIQWP
jgi:hypothetical protein